MPSYVPSKKGVQYIFYVTLEAWAGHIMQVNPTLAVGDAKVSTDGGAVGNLATLPAVDPAGSVFVKVTVSAGEMNGDNVKIWLHDAAGPADIDTLLARLTAARAAALDEITPARMSELDPANIPFDIDTLLARLTAARAAFLDELGPLNMPADIDTLLARLTAARAAYLDELAPANIPADIDALVAGLLPPRATFTL